jgi:hypothetical protein
MITARSSLSTKNRMHKMPSPQARVMGTTRSTARRQKPSPLNAFGGEGRVRGQRLHTDRPFRSTMQSPLTAALSFPKASSGKSESTALETA